MNNQTVLTPLAESPPEAQTPGAMKEADLLVRVENISKKFCRDLKKSLWYGVKDVASEFISAASRSRNGSTDGEDRPELRPGEFWANSDISFELRRGEALGLIGHNGAGKTTLLKMLNGLIKPDTGIIEMRGRVGALIALGAGFNPILTGRENIYVNGSILGFSKEEIHDKIDGIIEFAEVKDFIDSPVQSYSSGMQVRLGFAVASSFKPDVLIVDEVLAVGDVSFRTKCYNRINEICKDAAVIFVSHNMGQVGRLCDRAILLEKGRIKMIGKTDFAIDEYNKMAVEAASDWTLSDGFDVRDIKFNGLSSKELGVVDGGSRMQIDIDVEAAALTRTMEVILAFRQTSGDLTCQLNNIHDGTILSGRQGRSRISVEVPALYLGSGSHSLGVRIIDRESGVILAWNQSACRLNVEHPVHRPAPTYFPASFSVI